MTTQICNAQFILEVDQAEKRIIPLNISLNKYSTEVSPVAEKNKQQSPPLIGLFMTIHTFRLLDDTNWRSDFSQANKTWWWRHCTLLHHENKHTIHRLTNGRRHKMAISIQPWLEVKNCVDWYSLWPVALGCATTGCLKITSGNMRDTGWAACFTVRNVWLN